MDPEDVMVANFSQYHNPDTRKQLERILKTIGHFFNQHVEHQGYI